MSLFDTARTVVLLPGSGSDAQFLVDAFGEAVSQAGSRLIAVSPDPSDLVAGYRRALDDAAARATEPVVVGGVSIGAAVALDWAVAHPDHVAAVLVAMPAWTGDGSDSPAAASARATAHALRSTGIDNAVAAMTASSPAWLARMLARSWREQWPALPTALEHAALYDGPTAPALRAVRVPVGIAAATDDPIHPLAVAQYWREQIPGAVANTFDLDALGGDPGLLGRLSLDAVTKSSDVSWA